MGEFVKYLIPEEQKEIFEKNKEKDIYYKRTSGEVIKSYLLKKIKNFQIEYMSRIIDSNINIQFVDIINIELRLKNSMAIITEALKQNNNIVSLRMYECNFNDKSSKKLSEFLRYNKSLIYLQLNDTSQCIDSEFMEELQNIPNLIYFVSASHFRQH